MRSEDVLPCFHAVSSEADDARVNPAAGATVWRCECGAITVALCSQGQGPRADECPMGETWNHQDIKLIFTEERITTTSTNINHRRVISPILTT